MHNILVAIDFSGSTPKVIDSAVTIAQATQSKLWLLHVAAPEPDFLGYQTGPQTERYHVAEHLREEHRQLQDWAERLRQQDLETTALLIQGATVATIIQKSKKLAADLIVIGSHGKSGLFQVLVGSVSEGVLRQSTCPVLVVPTRP